MPHINELYDYVISVFISYKGKVLLVHHKKLNKWLPIGGHIELNEDPEQALRREVKEETGLEISLSSNKIELSEKGFKPLYTPQYLDVHDIGDTHKHIGLIYFATAKTDKVILAKKEHNAIKWFSTKELESDKYNILKNVIFYSKEAISSNQ